MTTDVKTGGMPPCECGHAPSDHTIVALDQISHAATPVRGKCEECDDCKLYTPDPDAKLSSEGGDDDHD